MSCDFRSDYPGPSLPPSLCQGITKAYSSHVLTLNDSMALAAIKHDRRYDRLGGGVIECACACHGFVTVVL